MPKERKVVLMPYRTAKHFVCPAGHLGKEFEEESIRSDAEDLKLKGLRGMKFAFNDSQSNPVYQCEICGQQMIKIPYK